MSAAGDPAAPRALARTAAAALESVLQASPDDLPAAIPDAVGALVRLRDDLIARRRAGEAAPPDWLPRTNAILSCVVGAEFPIKGLHRERLETALRATRELLASEGAATA